ncbi:MAG: hypothetical protein MUC97_04105 [Bernardetiaceae bacterium]|nr:hypothetical protein [Bernardetiaceae bacterium]
MSDFSRLSLSSKAMRLKTRGTYLGSRMQQGMGVALYWLNDFMVEVSRERGSGLIHDIKVAHGADAPYWA